MDEGLLRDGCSRRLGGGNLSTHLVSAKFDEIPINKTTTRSSSTCKLAIYVCHNVLIAPSIDSSIATLAPINLVTTFFTIQGCATVINPILLGHNS
ncbi:hypothetical protein VMCG_10649 [Cytospora schulzeri]|uniref:Uncharacterized protein n=1 Tax=Cytospora schulzeri TaxID=448051 RepID=A0A423VBA8_9PEZI|nr:hypothetical protein VMCG_10649 [Valsa malicola]